MATVVTTHPGQRLPGPRQFRFTNATVWLVILTTLLLSAITLRRPLGAALGSWGSASTGSITVSARDPDGVPLPGVTVGLIGSDGEMTEYTGADGSVEFATIPVGEYSIELRMVGFQTETADLLLSRGEKLTTAFSFQLAR